MEPSENKSTLSDFLAVGISYESPFAAGHAFRAPLPLRIDTPSMNW